VVASAALRVRPTPADLERNKHAAVRVHRERNPTKCNRDPAKSERNPTKCERSHLAGLRSLLAGLRNPTKCERNPARCERNPTRCERNPTKCERIPTKYERNPTKCERNPAKCERNPAKCERALPLLSSLPLARLHTAVDGPVRPPSRDRSVARARRRSSSASERSAAQPPATTSGCACRRALVPRAASRCRRKPAPTCFGARACVRACVRAHDARAHVPCHSVRVRVRSIGREPARLLPRSADAFTAQLEARPAEITALPPWERHSPHTAET
jgi:hypothetical protein